ncbi:MAG: hypothetical protein HY598_01610 [Candidatus Omnitrophica bacterium]|nr:hypothetical protein [Candidatus Omnitrophota bacterium]
MDVAILSLHEVLFNGTAQQVIVPGEQGIFEILPMHRPVVSLLLPGTIVIDEQKVLSIRRGVVKVAFDQVTAIVEPDIG